MLKETLLKATQAAGKVMEENFHLAFKITSKTTVNDLVTEVDKLSEKTIVEIIRGEFPDHYILSEEAGKIVGDSEYKWIIDPIDGTVNYAHGVPICCVSIGLEKQGEMLMGAVYNPFLNEFFFAEKDAGAMLNDRKIAVSEKSDLGSAFLVTGFPYKWEESTNGPMQVFADFVKSGSPVRRLGSAAIDLCWVACGRFDGFWEYNLNAWDSAAGCLIVREAGGKVTHFNGEEYSPYKKQLLATNGLIHAELVQVLGSK